MVVNHNFTRGKKDIICLFIIIFLNTKFFNTHTRRGGKSFKETYNGVYPKKINRHIICLFRNNLFSSLLKIFG